jgi:hypothetical protein
MSIASGFSIQRNDVIQVPHRTQYEVHEAQSGNNVYLLKSLIDYKDKTWEWDIRMGEVRIHLERGAAAGAVNVYNTASGGIGTQAGAVAVTEDQAFAENLYTEGSLTAGYGSLMFDSQYGEFGAIVFNATSAPIPGEKVEVIYTEDSTKFVGDGGMLFQLAHDMCIHPFNSSELFQSTWSSYTVLPTGPDTSLFDGSETTSRVQYTSSIPSGRAPGGNVAGSILTTHGGRADVGGIQQLGIYRNNLSISYNDMFDADGTEASQRAPKYLWKAIREHRETAVLSMQSSSIEAITAGDSGSYVTLMNNFPLVESDLGGGEFRVSINNIMLDRDDWTVSSEEAARKATFKLKRTAPMTWVPSLDNLKIDIAYIWRKSIDVPFGALVGRGGLGPNQVTTLSGAGSAAYLSFPHDSQVFDATIVPTATHKYWTFSRAFRSDESSTSMSTTPNGVNAFFGWVSPFVGTEPHIVLQQAEALNPDVGLENVAIIPDTSARHRNTAKITEGDLFQLTMMESQEYANPFRLIYPMPLTSTSQIDVKNKLRQITNKFLVESDKGVDLLSDTNLSWVDSYHPASNRKPQKWRMRFEWDSERRALKVNVGTEYQLRDDCSISEVQGRDGVKSPIFREPGELCDVYQSAAVGRGASLAVSRAKSQWFRKQQVERNIASTYPMSYKMTCTDHGIGLFVFDQAAVDQDDDYAWLVVQRHVNQSTGEPEFADKSPVHCVYSPSKRPVDVAGLTPYFATADVEDLSKPQAIYSTLGGILRTEAPTIYVNRDASFFDSVVNAVDFNGYGYASTAVPGQSLATNLSRNDIQTDLYRSITGSQSSLNLSLWSEKVYTFRVASGTLTNAVYPNWKVGQYIMHDNNASTAVPPVPTAYIGGRIKEYNPDTGVVTIVSVQDMTSTAFFQNNKLRQSVLETIAASGTPPDPYVLWKNGTSNTGDVRTNFVPFVSTTAPTTATAQPQLQSGVYQFDMPVLSKDSPQSTVTDLAVLGFNSLPRRRDTSIVLDASSSPAAVEQVSLPSAPFTPAIRSVRGDGALLTGSSPSAALFIQGNTSASSPSQNIIWPTNILGRMSTFKDASTTGTGVGTSIENISTSSYKSGDAALLDILYTAQPENYEKIFESMMVTLDDVEVTRDSQAYVLTYDEWVRKGDPNTVPRFMESLEAAGVTFLGTEFKIPATGTTAGDLPNFDVLVPGMDPTATGAAINYITNTTNNQVTGKKFFSEWAETISTIPSTNGINGGAWEAGVDYPQWEFTAGMLIESLNDQKLINKLPGDIIWTHSIPRNEYLYDFWNKSLYFKISPRAGTTFSISMINYQTANPSQGTYIISKPEDRNFPESNMNDIKTINRFVVREKDVLKPWDYHVSATMHEVDSHAIINPQEQLSITQGRNFVFSFPTQLTSQRFYYPESELDLICVSSADFSTQAGYVEIDKYSDSDGKKSTTNTTPAQTALVAAFGDVASNTGEIYNRFTIADADVGNYGGHTGPDGKVYIWKKNKRKYEGMPSTLPNGNGMRIFMQVTGSSIQHSDVEESAPPTS